MDWTSASHAKAKLQRWCSQVAAVDPRLFAAPARIQYHHRQTPSARSRAKPRPPHRARWIDTVDPSCRSRRSRSVPHEQARHGRAPDQVRKDDLRHVRGRHATVQRAIRVREDRRTGRARAEATRARELVASCAFLAPQFFEKRLIHQAATARLARATWMPERPILNADEYAGSCGHDNTSRCNCHACDERRPRLPVPAQLPDKTYKSAQVLRQLYGRYRGLSTCGV